jgi:diacylglycerol kinase (ATP)
MSNDKQRPLRDRLADGLRGIALGWRRERSFRTQLILLAAGGALLVAAGVSPAWLLAFAVIAALALAAELINAALEAILDRVHPDHDDEIGAAKDMSSAAVLVINVAAAVTFIAALLASSG